MKSKKVFLVLERKALKMLSYVTMSYIRSYIQDI